MRIRMTMNRTGTSARMRVDVRVRLATAWADTSAILAKART